MLRTGTEDLAASIATAGELGVVAVPAVDLVHLATELFVHQGHSAPVAQETGLVPMLILVRQILQTKTFVSTSGIILRSRPFVSKRKRMRWNAMRNGGGRRGIYRFTRCRLKETKLRYVRYVYVLRSISCNFDARRDAEYKVPIRNCKHSFRRHSFKRVYLYYIRNTNTNTNTRVFVRGLITIANEAS